MALLVLALAARGGAGDGVQRLAAAPAHPRPGARRRSGGPLDAERIRAVLRSHDAVAFPGFIGVDATGVPSVLGRGGSDLTALFLGHALEPAEVRLVKDVGGIFPSDPRVTGGDPPGATPLPALSWAQARAIGGRVVQAKALDFAQRRRLRFRVVGLDGAGTAVG